MPATERLIREQRFHDAQAAERARTFSADPRRLRFADDEYLNHAAWVRPAVERLGILCGREVLDWGCGHGMAAVAFARRGARVTACDLSMGYVRETQARARANQTKIRCVQADAHRTPFRAQTFDAVWGHAILHHLDVPMAAIELRRILKPDGVAVLCEPWGGNPLLRFARRWLPRSEQTDDERPLCNTHIEQLRAVFASVQIERFSIARPLPITRYVVLTLRP